MEIFRLAPLQNAEILIPLASGRDKYQEPWQSRLSAFLILRLKVEDLI